MMRNFEFQLDCGKRIKIDSFLMGWTYGGVLLGRPYKRVNQELIEDFMKRVKSFWGERKTYLLPPSLRIINEEVEYLPPIQCAAWLSSLESKELVVIWYCGENGNKSLTEFVSSNVKSIPWDTLAEEYIL